MDQGSLNFDLAEAERRKEEGIAQASDQIGRKFLLESARAIALAIASQRGSVTMDDVYKRMEEHGMHPEFLGNSAGSLFRGEPFVFTGEWRKSERVSNHARMNRVWKIRA